MRIFNMKKSKNNYRIESDSMGKVKIPKNSLYGPQTQRAINNFDISNLLKARKKNITKYISIFLKEFIF